MLLVTAFLAVLLFYAIPLVMLENVEPFQAVKDGIMGCLRNWLPLLVLGLILTLLTMLAMLPFGLGLLILGPVMVGAWYRSYKELYAG